MLNYPPPSENCTKDNFPLIFENVELEIRPAEANLDFIKRFIPKLEWDALVQTARSIGEDSLPEKLPEDKQTLENEEFLNKLHHVLMEVSCKGSYTDRGEKLMVYLNPIREIRFT
jgi:multifunctional methyltransferase subunit TRM112